MHTNTKQMSTISQSNLPFLLLGMASRPCSSAADEEGHADVPEKRDEAGWDWGGTDDDVVDVPANILEPGDCVGGDPKGFWPPWPENIVLGSDLKS